MPLQQPALKKLMLVPFFSVKFIGLSYNNQASRTHFLGLVLGLVASLQACVYFFVKTYNNLLTVTSLHERSQQFPKFIVLMGDT